MSSLKQLAMRAAIWAVTGYGASQILRFASNLWLTHLLLPEAFGLTALIGSLIGGLHMFSDIGLVPSLMRNQKEDPVFDNTAWTIGIVRGGVITLVCLLFTWPAAQFYKEPLLLQLIPVAALTNFLSSFISTGMAVINRRLSVKTLIFFELLGQVVNIVVTITWATFHPTVWALLAGGGASTIVQLVLSHRINPGEPNRFAWDAKARAEIVSFGRWIFLSTIITFLATQIDRPILGKLLGFQMLGVYGIAYALADVPKTVINTLGDKVVFPLYTKFADLPRAEFRYKVEQGRRLVLYPAAIGLAFIVCLGDVFVSFVYPNKYADATWMLPLLALGIWPLILNSTIDQTLIALGKMQFFTLANFVSAVFLIGGMIVGFDLMGSVGAVAAVPFSNVPLYMVLSYGLHREKLLCIGQDIKATALFVAVVAFLLAIRALIGYPSPLTGLH